ncbi:hypothetical protein WJX74_009635 [Apatococcus lobatus]|uniref:PRA1 family protein n=1 Tax=Apatococcus lobatus TaxID=904363 RepID=A0AAW1QXI0_9CHLO
MDWSLVTPGELLASLQEVQWNEWPHNPAECFRSLILPRASWSDLSPRLKCNLYHFRTNYGLSLLLAQLIALRQSPTALTAVLMWSFGTLCLNNTFCNVLNVKTFKALRLISPRVARRLQMGGSSSIGLGAPQSRGRKQSRIGGMPRVLTVLVIWGAGGLLLFRSQRLISWTLGTLTGLSLILMHASMRSPNLKARLANARDEFRAVWRGYQADSRAYGQHDYLL